jgi:putative hydrolase of the HAD superfamily
MSLWFIVGLMTFAFDLDGVVCVGGSFTAALEREHGIPAERLRPFFSGEFRGCLLGRRDLKTELKPRLAEWGWHESVEAFLAFWFQTEHVICPEIMDCVRTLRSRGHHCVLATNQERYRVAYMRREMALEGEFDDLFVSCEIGVAKPAAEFFFAIQKRLGAAATDLLLIDDSEPNAEGARAAGWDAMHYRGRADVPQILRESCARSGESRTAKRVAGER